MSGGVTLIEPERWEMMKRRVYLPEEVDEYQSSSEPLNNIILESIHSLCPSSKPLKKGYVSDLCREGGISPCALVLGLLYIQRLSKMNPVYLAKTSPSDVFLTAMVVASKYLQDEGELEALVNSEWAQIGQRQKNVVDGLERTFLQAISWNLYVSLEEYYQFFTAVEARVAVLQAGRRGWWSYSDLASLWDSSGSPQMMMDTSKHVAKVVGGSMAVYVVCIAALVTSAQNVSVGMETGIAQQIKTASDSAYTPGLWSLCGHNPVPQEQELDYTRKLSFLLKDIEQLKQIKLEPLQTRNGSSRHEAPAVNRTHIHTIFCDRIPDLGASSVKNGSTATHISSDCHFHAPCHQPGKDFTKRRWTASCTGRNTCNRNSMKTLLQEKLIRELGRPQYNVLTPCG